MKDLCANRDYYCCQLVAILNMYMELVNLKPIAWSSEARSPIQMGQHDVIYQWDFHAALKLSVLYNKVITLNPRAS